MKSRFLAIASPLLAVSLASCGTTIKNEEKTSVAPVTETPKEAPAVVSASTGSEMTKSGAAVTVESSGSQTTTSDAPSSLTSETSATLEISTKKTEPKTSAPAANSGSSTEASGSTSVTSEKPVSKTKTHTQTVSYVSPAGKEEIKISVTTDNGVITAVTAEALASNPISKMKQEAFGKAVAGTVVGKDIDTLAAHAIGGASLTTEAFVQYVHSF